MTGAVAMADKAKGKRKGKQYGFWMPDTLYARLARVADRREQLKGIPGQHALLIREAIEAHVTKLEAELGINNKE
jgi:predicted DNA-binding protein